MQYSRNNDPAFQNNPHYRELSWDYGNAQNGGGQLQSVMPPDNNNSPCDNPNPPAWCNDATIPVDPGITIMISAFLFGLLLIKNLKNVSY